MVGSEIKDIISGTESFGSAAVMIVLIGLMGWWTFRTYKEAAQRGKKGNGVWGWILIAIGVIGYLGKLRYRFVNRQLLCGMRLCFFRRHAAGRLFKESKKDGAETGAACRTCTAAAARSFFTERTGDRAYRSDTQSAAGQENPEFSSNLRDSRDFIIETVKKSGETAVGKQLMTTISNLLSIYLDTADNAIQTDQTQKNLLQIENAFVEVRKALASLYDKTYSSENIDLSAEITAMNMMLKQDGLLGSDFEPSGNPLQRKQNKEGDHG